MNTVKIFVYLVLTALVFEVLKTMLGRFPFTGSYFIASILAGLQFLLLFFFFLWVIARFFFRIGKSKRPGAWAMVIAAMIIVLGELVCLWALKRPSYIPSAMLRPFQYYYDYNAGMIQFDQRASVYDAELFYRLRPNSRFVYQQQEFADSFRVNSAGLRDDELSLQSPDIICIGDSYTMGWGVSETQGFAGRLEGLSGLKTLNAGISSYGTAREMILLRKLDTSRLKFLVVQYCANDLRENQQFVDSSFHLAISAPAIYQKLVSEQALNTSYYPGKAIVSIMPWAIKNGINKIHPFFNLAFERENSVNNISQHASNFLKCLAFSKLDFSRVKVIVTFMDSREHMQAPVLREVERQLQEAGNKDIFRNNVFVLDMSPILAAEDFYRLDLHIKPSGHQKMASAIAAKIMSLR